MQGMRNLCRRMSGRSDSCGDTQGDQREYVHRLYALRFHLPPEGKGIESHGESGRGNEDEEGASGPEGEWAVFVDYR